MGRRLLVVEDSRVVSGLVTDALVRHGYECLQAFDGREALELFESACPDALVLDLNIPETHGLEVLRRVKSARPQTVVVVLTGHGSEQTAIQAVKLGADDYLTKPFREMNLVESLAVHLRRAGQQRGTTAATTPAKGAGERHLARVLLDAPVAIVQASGPEAKIRAVNGEAARMLATSPEELLGQGLEELAAPEIRGNWIEAVRREAGSPRGYEGEVHLVGQGGTFPANVVAVERPEPGDLLLALRDLTRQKAFERRYFESKKLASLGRVVEGVAHEVRNPLISIGGFARKLREGTEGRPRKERYLDVIISEVERLEQMVRDIEGFVEFSRRSRGPFGRVEVGPLLRETVASMAEAAEATGVSVQAMTAPGESTVFGDAELLRELFHGLMENACEAMPGGGELAVEVRHLDTWVQVRVKDTGIGIPEEDLDAIFDPFFTSKTTGSGLGLAKAHLIVEEHHGTIDFESSIGHGTVCTVSLPRERRSVQRSTG